MSDSGRNTAASVRQRLLNRARSDNEDFQALLTRYACERFLYRLSRSEYGDRFVLKGAMLFALWEGNPHRITRDLDLLGFGSLEVHDLVEIVRAVCVTNVEDDGLVFIGDTAIGSRIREDQEYEGVRVKVRAQLGTAQVQVQIDIGVGDAITPSASEMVFPTILDFQAPVIKTYPRETVVAEKLQSIVILGMANGRMKDFYDLAYLARRFAFEGSLLSAAIGATFERRRTAVPSQIPVALTDQFAADSIKTVQWKAFLRRVGIVDEEALVDTIEELRLFLLPPLEAVSSSHSFERQWVPPGPWEPQLS